MLILIFFLWFIQLNEKHWIYWMTLLLQAGFGGVIRSTLRKKE